MALAAAFTRREVLVSCGSTVLARITGGILGRRAVRTTSICRRTHSALAKVTCTLEQGPEVQDTSALAEVRPLKTARAPEPTRSGRSAEKPEPRLLTASGKGARTGGPSLSTVATRAAMRFAGAARRVTAVTTRSDRPSASAVPGTPS